MQGAAGRLTEAPTYSSLPGRHYCPVILPYFSFARGRDRLSGLRRAVYAAQLAGNSGRSRRTPFYTVVWPFKSLVKSWQASRVWGEPARRLGAPPPWRQLPRLWWLAVRHNLSFGAYFGFRLWRDEVYAQAIGFVENFEAIWFGDLLFGDQDIGMIDDKRRFEHFCREHGLPTIPVIASISPAGRLSWHSGEAALPAADLFVKGYKLWAGHGTACWEWDHKASVWCRGHEQLDQCALLERLCAEAREGGLIIQRRVGNHPAVADLSPNALSTLRCMTWRCNGNPAATYRAFWRLPRAGMITDHASSGALLAAVETDGRLSRPRSKLLAEHGDDHPDFDVRITGRVLPQYDEALALAQQAHDASKLDGLISWDVALLESGPTLVEGNSIGGIDSLQIAFDEPVGGTEFVDIAERLLNAANAASSASA